MSRSFMNASWAVASCVLVAPVSAQAMRGNNPFIGVWKVNVERSVYPGPRPPSDQTTFYQFTPMPDGSTRFTLSSRNAAGPTMMISIFRVDAVSTRCTTSISLQRSCRAGRRRT